MTATDDRIDVLSAQMDFIVAELQEQRAARERMAELMQTMTPVTRQAMDMASRELEDLEIDTAELAATLRLLIRSLPQIEALLAQLEPLSELAEQATHLSGPAMAKLTDALAEADDRGYFAFARQGGRIADRVVTEFSEEDVAALGDNIVTILGAVKEMTQPEVMGLVRRTAISVQDVEETHTEPPSMFELLKSMRDPQTRRGLGRVMAMLHTVGEEPTTTERNK